MKRIAAGLALVLALGTLSACGSDSDAGSGPAAGPVEVKVAWTKATAQMALPIAVAKGFDKEFGVSIVLQGYPSAPEATQSVITGQAEASIGSHAPTVPSLIQKGAPLKAIMVYARGGDRVAMVSSDPTITSAANLRGKTVATQVGSDTQEFLHKALAAAGLKVSDIKEVNMGHSDVPPALETKQIDAATLNEPQLSGYLAKGENAHILERAGKYISLAGVICMTEDFIASKADVAYGIYLALTKADQYIRQVGATSDEIATIVSAATGATSKANATAGMDYVTFDSRITKYVLDRNAEEQQWYVQNSPSALASVVPSGDVFDTSLQDKAMKEHPELFADIKDYLTKKGAPSDQF